MMKEKQVLDPIDGDEHGSPDAKHPKIPSLASIGEDTSLTLIDLCMASLFGSEDSSICIGEDTSSSALQGMQRTSPNGS